MGVSPIAPSSVRNPSYELTQIILLSHSAVDDHPSFLCYLAKRAPLFLGGSANITMKDFIQAQVSARGIG